MGREGETEEAMMAKRKWRVPAKWLKEGGRPVPARFTPSELKKVGVAIVSGRVRLRCTACDKRWTVEQREGGRMPRHFGRCPRGCNEPLPEIR